MTLAISDVLKNKSRKNFIDGCMEEVKNQMNFILRGYESEELLKDIVDDCLNSSGKMIRSKLLIATSLLTNNEFYDRAICQCAAVEITHLASLIHDDIIDDSILRRGFVSTQAKYGKDIAVFSGDFLIARVFSYLIDKRFYEEAMIISKTIEHMCNGEVGQNSCKYKYDISEERYFENISGKTASFFKTVCYFGARNAGFNDEMIEKISEFGLNLGLMFQLKDDLLDVFKSKEETGKEEFKDFKEGIYTYPVIKALEDDRYKDKILFFINLNREKALTKEDVLSLRSVFLNAGADFKTYKKINLLAKRNREILKDLPKIIWVENY